MNWKLNKNPIIIQSLQKPVGDMSRYQTFIRILKEVWNYGIMNTNIRVFTWNIFTVNNRIYYENKQQNNHAEENILKKENGAKK